MKRSALLLLIATGLAASTVMEADGQQRRRRNRSSFSESSAQPGDSTYYYKGRNRGYTAGKPINESTTGVLGQDTIKLNQKGKHRNLNSNTGQPLPPNNGKVGGL